MLIVEGPDGSGKTTLVGRITAHWHGYPRSYNIPVVHSVGPATKGPLFDWAMRTLDEAQDAQILDRFPYFSEPVYGDVLRRDPPLMTPDQLLILRRRLISLDPLVIYCRPPLVTMKEQVKKRPQMKGVLGNYEKIVEAYDWRFASWSIDFHTFHYDSTNITSVVLLVNLLKAHVRERAGRGEWI